MTQMIMVPSENQRRQDLLRNLSKALGIHHFGLLITHRSPKFGGTLIGSRAL